MRILTTLSGIFLSIMGAVCFMFSANSFTDLAFPIGVVMIISGIACIFTYITAIKKEDRLPDTLLVEGIVTFLFGFTAINNQVADVMLSMFFGAWLVMSGASRLTQAIAVRRYNPADWKKILPLAIISIILGAVLLTPAIISAATPLTLIGAAYIIDGFSQIIYAMYVRVHVPTKREIASQKRLEIKEAEHKEKQAQRAAMRKLSKEERTAAKEQIKNEKKQASEEKKAAKAMAKADAEAAKRDTIEIPDSVSMAQAAKEFEKEHPEQLEYEKSEAERRFGVKANAAAESEKQEESASSTIWKKPTDIPSMLEAKNEAESGSESEKREDLQPAELKHSAVDLSELESEVKAPEFESVELPEVEIISGDADKIVEREDILSDLDKEIEKPSPFTAYTPISLDELVAETVKGKKYDPEDAKRFTQTLTLDWYAED